VNLLKEVIRKAANKILLIIKEKNPNLKKAEATARKIAIGALAFNDFKHRRTNDINFDWNAVLSFEGDTGPYVINAYVRLCSILRKHALRSGADSGRLTRGTVPDFGNLQEPESRQLINVLSMFPEKVTAVLEKDDPYLLGQYALTLADRVHSFIHACRVIGSPQESERLLLADCSRLVLKNTLDLLGIPLVEEM
jgi:arginyl-tRNA synthetase